MSANVSSNEEETTEILDPANLATDFTSILTPIEYEIAQSLKQSRDIGIEAVTKAYNLYGGDFSSFNESNCFKYMEQQMVLEVMSEYECKSQVSGMSAKELNSSTAGVLAKKFAGREADLTNIKKLKVALDKQIKRKKEKYADLLQKYWVSINKVMYIKSRM